MNPEFAAGLRSFLLQALGSEIPATERVILAMPNDRLGYAPDEKSTPALKLAFHIVSSEIAFLEFAVSGAMDRFMAPMPDSIKTGADVIAYRDAARPAALAAAEALTGEQLAKDLTFFGAFTFPAVVYLNWANSHSIHHRGQLSSYLRSMGGKVPSIYGGSADEPFNG
ncbi:MAG: DinB family protein [Acidobacteria bacterium]|nr:DinB family protein [Acidobacteriota bacterium]